MIDNLVDIVSQFAGKKVLVLGDVMLDEYIVGTASRISPEAPVPVVKMHKVFYYPGGAANVAVNISSLGGMPYLIGLVGHDREGERLKSIFADYGVDISGVIADQDRPTTLKTRIVAQGQQIVRVDREVTEPIDSAVMQSLLSNALRVLDEVDVVLISDYAKGITAPFLLREIIYRAGRLGKKVVVDPKGQDYSKYRGATVITPNEREAGQAVGKEITDENSLLYAGATLLKEIGGEAILITRGEEGMSLFLDDGEIYHLPTVAREVYDVTGAGDTVVATLSLGLATGASWRGCARLANEAAGIVVGKVGTATVSVQELLLVTKRERVR